MAWLDPHEFSAHGSGMVLANTNSPTYLQVESSGTNETGKYRSLGCPANI